MLKKTLLFTALATLLNMEAQSLVVQNSREAVKFYLRTTIDGKEYDEELFTAKAHETTNRSILPQLGDLRAELTPDKKRSYARKLCIG